MMTEEYVRFSEETNALDYLEKTVEFIRYAQVDGTARQAAEDEVQDLYEYALELRKRLVTPAIRKELIAMGAYWVELSVTPPQSEPVAKTNRSMFPGPGTALGRLVAEFMAAEPEVEKRAQELFGDSSLWSGL
jgi:hypothetical protein